MRPPYVAPYFCIAFAAACCFFLTLDFGKNIYNKVGWRIAILDFVSLTTPGVFVMIAGMLPLRTILPSMNVAGPNDVSFNRASVLGLN